MIVQTERQVYVCTLNKRVAHTPIYKIKAECSLEGFAYNMDQIRAALTNLNEEMNARAF